jgi:hypothetical protein
MAETWKIGFGGPGFDIFQVTAHEIGHALGLAHTDVPNSLMNPFYSEAFRGLQADDIAGVRSLYGPVNSTPKPEIDYTAKEVPFNFQLNVGRGRPLYPIGYSPTGMKTTGGECRPV